MKKILVIRFSSFGDIVQASAINSAVKKRYPEVELIWLTKKAFEPLLFADPNVDKVKSLESFRGTISIFRWIKSQKFDFVYDAHYSLRSSLLFLLTKVFSGGSLWIRRSKHRWKRYLLFTFRINLFPKPFVGQASYLAPLKSLNISIEPNKTHWNFDEKIIKKVDELLGSGEFIVLAPSAAWEMKRWPINHWNKLIKIFIEKFPDTKVVLVGGPNDRFINDFYSHPNVINLSGKLSLLESSYLVTKANVTVSADTGIIHVVDAHQKPGILLNGPTAFGKTFSPSIKILEAGLYCQPCSKDGRGKCERQVYQQCMVDIAPELVLEVIKDKL